MVRLYRTCLPLALCLLAAVSGYAWSAASPTIESKYPGLSSGVLRQAVPGVVSGALAEADGMKITSGDLAAQLAKMRSPAKEQYGVYQFALLEDMITSRLIDKEARTWALNNSIFGLQGEELMRQFADSLVGGVKVSDEEALAFYKENADQFGSATYEQMASSIKSYLQGEKVNALLRNHIATLSSRHSIRISDVWAKQQYRKWIQNPIEQARRSGKPTLVKFGADTCMPCRVMAPIIKELGEKHKGKFNLLDINTDKEPVMSIQYGAEAIPLLIFYDKDGKEILRHTGGWDKASIEAGLARIGVQ